MANKTVTVKSSGGDYTSLNAALAGESTDLVTNTRILTIECYAMEDTTAADTGTGYTTSSSYYINITVPSSDRHDGTFDTTSYYMTNAGSPALNIRESYTRCAWIQIDLTSNVGSQIAIQGSLDTIVNNCIIKKSGSGGSGNQGIAAVTSSGAYSYFFNNIIYGINYAAIFCGGGSGGQNTYIYNNTIRSCGYAFYLIGSGASGTTKIKNNIVNDLTSGIFQTYTATGLDATNTHNNLCDDFISGFCIGATVDSGNTDGIGADTSKLRDTGQNFLTTCIAGMLVKNTTDTTYAYIVSVDSDTQLTLSADIMDDSENYTIYNNYFGEVTFVGEGDTPPDLHLASGDTVAKDKGTSSVDSLFTDDIDGVTRTGTWDIGADEYVSAGVSASPEKAKHTQKAKEPSFVQNHYLDVENSKHIQKVVEPILNEISGAVEHSVTPEKTIHKQTATESNLYTQEYLQPDNTKHIQTIKEPILESHVLQEVTPENTKHAQTLTEPQLYTREYLQPENGIHAQKVVEPDLSVLEVLTVENAKHTQIATEPVLNENVAGVHSVTPENSIHILKTTDTNLYVGHYLQSDDTIHSQKVTEPTIVYHEILSPENAKHVQKNTQPPLTVNLPILTLTPQNAKHRQNGTEPDFVSKLVLTIGANKMYQYAGEPSYLIPGLIPLPTDNLTLESITTKYTFTSITDRRTIHAI